MNGDPWNRLIIDMVQLGASIWIGNSIKRNPFWGYDVVVTFKPPPCCFWPMHPLGIEHNYGAWPFRVEFSIENYDFR